MLSQSYDCICIACGEKQLSQGKDLCSCGHVLKDSLCLGEGHSRPRRISVLTNPDLQYLLMKEQKIDRKSRKPAKRNDNMNKKKIKKTIDKVPANKKRSPVKKSKRNNDKSSETTVNTTNCRHSKKYQPAKPAPEEFEFDFSLFDSNDPCYPKALDDINFKIFHTNSFWKNVALS